MITIAIGGTPVTELEIPFYIVNLRKKMVYLKNKTELQAIPYNLEMVTAIISQLNNSRKLMITENIPLDIL